MGQTDMKILWKVPIALVLIVGVGYWAAYAVQPVSTSTARTALIVASVVILAEFFYISNTTHHRWIGILRRQKTPVPDLKPIVAGGQGRAARSYGDNRSNIGD